MTERSELKVGSFYWVRPVLDVDTDIAWHNEDQPARFAGWHGGQELWDYLSQDGPVDWPVKWIGSEITK